MTGVVPLSQRSTEELQLQVKKLQRQKAALEARDSMIKYMRLISPDEQDPEDATKSAYDAQPHHFLIADAIERMERGEWLRVAFSMPPQSGKSALISRGGISWISGRNPHWNIMFGTYNQDFANEFGDDVRTIMQGHAHRQVFPRHALRTGSKAKDHMVTTKNGKLSFLGRKGSGTGRPADWWVIDDLLKDRQEAESAAIRDEAWYFLTRVATTRMHNLSRMIIVFTRWSDDDPLGRLLDPRSAYYKPKVAEQWKYINIPAIMDDTKIAHALGKQVGDALWPQRFSLSLLETAREMDPVGFSALYQGKPTPPEGAFFKHEHFTFYDDPSQWPAEVTWYGAGDLAVSDAAKADSSVVGNFGVDPKGDLWLHWDLYWERKLADESVERILHYGASFRWLTFFSEKGPIDRAVRPFLKKRMQEAGAYFHIEAMPVAASKAARAVAIRGLMAQRRVHLPRFAPWWPRAQEVLLKFTGSGADASDDFVDMLANMGQGMESHIRANVVEARTIEGPKVGTFAWTIRAAKDRALADKRRAALRGM